MGSRPEMGPWLVHSASCSSVLSTFAIANGSILSGKSPNSNDSVNRGVPSSTIPSAFLFTANANRIGVVGQVRVGLIIITEKIKRSAVIEAHLMPDLWCPFFGLEVLVLRNKPDATDKI